ncbi:hypothetical protein BH10ACI3_BH10ACI3_00560 [soil metagenome]
MASAAITTQTSVDNSTAYDHSLELLRAPFSLRCAAFAIDYMVGLAVPALWLVFGKSLAGNTFVGIGGWVWALGIIIFIANFVIFPMLRGKTLGKLLLGLTIVNLDGTPISFSHALRRNVLGYLLTLLTLGIGFFISAVNNSGRTLQDWIGGTIVIRGSRTQV